MAGTWAMTGLAGQVRRLLAAAIAVIIGVGFLTASTGVLGAAQVGLENAVAGGMREADLVVLGQDAGDVLSREQHDAVADLALVQRVDGEVRVWSEYGAQLVLAAPVPAGGVTLLQGAMPSATGEVLVGTALADTAGLGAGDELRLQPLPADPDLQADPVVLQVAGVGDLGTDPALSFGAAALVTSDATLRDLDPSLGYPAVRVHLTEGADPSQARAALGEVAPGARVVTGEEAAQERLAAMTGGTAVMAALLLGFGAIALATAALVIANTFTITLTQRTAELALLRCIGATRGQVRRMVLVESLLLGLFASTLGVLAGLGVGALLLAVGRRSDLPLPLADGLVPGVGPGSVLLPLVAGVLVTVVAGLWPGLRAARVPPLAALRPAGPVPGAGPVSRLRVALAALLVAGGVAAMLLAASTGSVPAGLAGGLLSFAGVLLAAVVVVPRGVRLLGLGARMVGVPGRLAVDNAVRNPGRAAATSAALVVGVTLITMTSVGAASGERTAMAEIDRTFAVDAVLATQPETGDGDRMLPTELGRDAGARVREVPGVASVTVVDTAYLRLDGQDWTTTAYGLEPAQASRALHGAGQADAVRPGSVGMGEFEMTGLGLEPGDPIGVSGPGGTRELTVTELSLGYAVLTLAAEDLRALAGAEYAGATALVRLDAGAEVAATVSGLQEVSGEAGLMLSGAAPDRAAVTGLLDALVLAATALLGVAVVIAVVGIANTLSLSVIERHREHALLRGLGLTRTQMRVMLLTEGVLLALVSTVIGVLLGLGYALLGVQTILPEGTTVVLAVPWAQILTILGVAVLAGVLASVLPARRAVRVSPAQGLAAA